MYTGQQVVWIQGTRQSQSIGSGWDERLTFVGGMSGSGSDLLVFGGGSSASSSFFGRHCDGEVFGLIS